MTTNYKIATGWALAAVLFMLMAAQTIIAHIALDYSNPGPPPAPRVVTLNVEWTKKIHYCCSTSACRMHHVTFDYVYREGYK